MIYEGKQKIWSDYQKDIPDDHYFYVRSCIRQSFFSGFRGGLPEDYQTGTGQGYI